MKIVKGYTVAGQLLVQGHTDLVAKVGDIVRLYLDQVSDPELPEFIRATVETPIIPLQNGTQTSYGFSYDETLLDGAITRLRAKDIVDVLVYSTQGRSAYESYLITTDDDPVLTEAEWVATPDLSDLNDVAISSPTNGQTIFRNGSNLWVNRAIVSADVSDATSAATANTVVKRGSAGQASFATSGLSGGSAVTVTSSSPSPAITASSQLGYGVDASSDSGGGIRARTASGTYHAFFGVVDNDRSFIARDNGAFGWFRNSDQTLTIEAAATLDANRAYIIPDATGTTVPIVPEYASLTAANAAALGAGTFFWNLALKKLQVTTA